MTRPCPTCAVTVAGAACFACGRVVTACALGFECTDDAHHFGLGVHVEGAEA